MKKKYILTGIIIVIIVIVSIYLLTRPDKIGNLNYNYSGQITRTSTISFSGEAGDRIKFSFRSDIKSGDLDIILYDSEGNEVYKLDRAKELETFFNLNNSDTYTLAAECHNFVGRYKVSVYKVK